MASTVGVKVGVDVANMGVLVGRGRGVGEALGSGVLVGASTRGAMATVSGSSAGGVGVIKARFGVGVAVCTSKLTGKPAGMAVLC